MTGAGSRRVGSHVFKRRVGGKQAGNLQRWILACFGCEFGSILHPYSSIGGTHKVRRMYFDSLLYCGVLHFEMLVV